MPIPNFQFCDIEDSQFFNVATLSICLKTCESLRTRLRNIQCCFFYLCQYADELYGPEHLPSPEDSDPDDGQGDGSVDIEAEVAKEIERLKGGKGKDGRPQRRRFQVRVQLGSEQGGRTFIPLPPKGIVHVHNN